MAEEKKKTTTARKKPKFLRTDWHKKIRLGKGVKKNLKWHGAKGRQNKLRLNRKGRMQRPKVGWGSPKSIRNLVLGISAVRVENVKDIEAVKKDVGIIIGKVGKKKRLEIIKRANELKITILNRYMPESKTLEVAGNGLPVAGKDKTTKGDKK